MQDVAERREEIICIIRELHFFFCIAAVQLERNHDKLMQQRGIKRLENMQSSVITVRCHWSICIAK